MYYNSEFKFYLIKKLIYFTSTSVIERGTCSYLSRPPSLVSILDPSPPTSDPCSSSPLVPCVWTTTSEVRPEILRGLGGPTMGSHPGCSCLLLRGCDLYYLFPSLLSPVDLRCWCRSGSIVTVAWDHHQQSSMDDHYGSLGPGGLSF